MKKINHTRVKYTPYIVGSRVAVLIDGWLHYATVIKLEGFDAVGELCDGRIIHLSSGRTKVHNGVTYWKPGGYRPR